MADDDMSHIAKQIFDAFGSLTLYEILNITVPADSEGVSNVDPDTIKHAYRKSALRYHPDKGGSPDQFRAVSLAYSILSDPTKKELYDKTGDVDAETDEFSDDFDFWYEYYRSMFPKITTADITKYEKEYIGSFEERSDVIDAYMKVDGDVKKLMEYVMFAEDGDEDHICEIIDSAIRDDTIVSTKKYEIFKSRNADLPKKKKRKQKKEEAIDLQDTSISESSSKGNKKKSTSNDSSLTEMILARQRSHQQQFKNNLKILENQSNINGEVYPDDEEFERFQKELFQNQKKK